MNDKLKHFLLCAGISIATLAVLLWIGTDLAGYEKLIAIMIGTGAALAKELIWDKWMGKGTPEFYDFLAGLWGAYVGTFVWIAVEIIIIEMMK